MKTFFTADTHFGHQRIIELCNRPFDSVDEMNDALVDGINSVVGRERLVILGDVCLGKLDDSLEVLSRIEAAEIVLIPGNHDRWSLAYHHKGDAEGKRRQFHTRYDNALGGRGVVFVDHEPSAWRGLTALTGEWDGPEALDDVLFSHYPYQGDSHSDEDRYAWLRPVDKGQPIIHGHVHEEWAENGRQFNVGVDVRGFKPVSEEEIEAWIETL